jgi:hypothetical protein
MHPNMSSKTQLEKWVINFLQTVPEIIISVVALEFVSREWQAIFHIMASSALELCSNRFQ